jgi:hypothetical protein
MVTGLYFCSSSDTASRGSLLTITFSFCLPLVIVSFFPLPSIVMEGLLPIKEYLAHFSPPSTLSSRKHLLLFSLYGNEIAFFCFFFEFFKIWLQH